MSRIDAYSSRLSGRSFLTKPPRLWARTAGGARPAERWMPTSIVVSYVMRHRPRVKRMRRVGELVGGREPRIAEAIAAAARRGPLTLRKSIETAGHHLRRHILAAVFASGRRSR